MELDVEVLGVVGTVVVVDFVVVVVDFVVVVVAGVVEGLVGEGSGLEVVVVEDFFPCLFRVFCCNRFHQETVVWWWVLKCFL